MGTVIYKKGDKHLINGVLCDFEVVELEYVAGELAVGGVLDPHDLDPKSEPEPESESKPVEVRKLVKSARTPVFKAKAKGI